MCRAVDVRCLPCVTYDGGRKRELTGLGRSSFSRVMIAAEWLALSHCLPFANGFERQLRERKLLPLCLII